jgi:hypothetical protein
VKWRHTDHVGSDAVMVSGSSFRVSGVGFSISGLGFRVWGLGFRVLGFGLSVSGFGLRILGFGFGVSSSVFRVSGFGFRAKREQPESVYGLFTESQGHNLAVAAFRVPHSLDSAPPHIPGKHLNVRAAVGPTGVPHS